MPTLRSIIAFWTIIAHRTASTTLRNSTRAPSPVRLNTRPFWLATVGSMSSERSVRNRASVRSSSALAIRLKPTTSAARIAAILRISAIVHNNTKADQSRVAALVKGFGRRPLARGGAGHDEAGVGKPPKEETAFRKRRWRGSHVLWGFEDRGLSAPRY